MACAPPPDALAPVEGLDAERGAEAASPDALALDTAVVSDDREHCPEGATWCEVSEIFGFPATDIGYGRGLSLVDVDGDGREDLWQSDEGYGVPGLPQRSGLWRNLGGHFVRWDVGIRSEHLRFNWAGVWGDVDNDGDPDLLLVGGGYNGATRLAFYLNDLSGSGRFYEATDAAGLGYTGAWWGASFADPDGDGDLDLVATTITRDAGTERRLGKLCPPSAVPLSMDGPIRLFENDGRGHFSDATWRLGLPYVTGDTKGPVWFDADGDGDDDLYLPVYPGFSAAPQSYLLRNDGETFTDVTQAWLPRDGWYSVFVVGAADFDQDGDEDLYLGRGDLPDKLLVNEGGGAFTVRGSEIGIDLVAWPGGGENAMGLGVGDLDGDGWPDVVVGPGSPTVKGRPIPLCNVTGRDWAPYGVRFRRCADALTRGHLASMHHGIVLGDIDGDLDADVLFNLGGSAEDDFLEGRDNRQRLVVYEQRSDPTSARHVAVRLRGTVSARDGVGAHLRVLGDRVRHLFFRSHQGFVTRNGTWQLVPLGEDDAATVEIDWPSGAHTVHRLRAGARWTLAEDARDVRHENLGVLHPFVDP